MNNKSFTYQSITDLSKLLKNKIISPVELTNHFLNKLENEGSFCHLTDPEPGAW